MSIIFEKYHGFGTNYLIYDINRNKREITKDMVLSVFKNNLGYGLIAILAGPYKNKNDDEYRCDVYYPNGEKAMATIMDSTIFHRYLIDRNYILDKKEKTMQNGGYKTMLTNSNTVTVSMTDVSFHSDEISMNQLHGDMINIPFYFGGREYWGTCLSHHGSHMVIPMEHISSDKIKQLGALAEHSKYFKTSVSTEIVKVRNRKEICVEMYETGLGYTATSITCATAACAAMYKLGLIDKDVLVHLPSGSIEVSIDTNQDMNVRSTISSIGHVYIMNESVNPMLKTN